MAGRPRKPRATKILQGTFQACRNPVQEPEPERIVDEEDLKIPTASALGPEGRKIFNRIGKILVEERILTVADVDMLQSLSQTYELMVESWKAIYRPVDKDGRQRRRKLSEYMAERDFIRKQMGELMTYEANRHEFIMLCNQLGLSPVARNKIDVGAKNEESDLEKLLKTNA